MLKAFVLSFAHLLPQTTFPTCPWLLSPTFWKYAIHKSTTQASYTCSVSSCLHFLKVSDNQFLCSFHTKCTVFKDCAVCKMNIISQPICVMHSLTRDDYRGLHWAALMCSVLTWHASVLKGLITTCEAVRLCILTTGLFACLYYCWSQAQTGLKWHLIQLSSTPRSVHRCCWVPNPLFVQVLLQWHEERSNKKAKKQQALWIHLVEGNTSFLSLPNDLPYLIIPNYQ